MTSQPVAARVVISWMLLVLTLASCSSGSESRPSAAGVDAEAAMVARVAALDESVEAWAGSGTIEEAWMWAEAASNLVVGASGPGYGDVDGDGVISGESDTGVLPGLDGTPGGLAMPLAANPCVERDVLGGDWSDPESRWETMADAIEAWEPGNNTMPGLPSHPMRVVGWATFTLETDELDLAHEYASHAGLHVAVTERALDC